MKSMKLIAALMGMGLMAGMQVGCGPTDSSGSSDFLTSDPLFFPTSTVPVGDPTWNSYTTPSYIPTPVIDNSWYGTGTDWTGSYVDSTWDSSWDDFYAVDPYDTGYDTFDYTDAGYDLTDYDTYGYDTYSYGTTGYGDDLSEDDWELWVLYY